MNNEVNYSMEELVPIVGKLVKKYTSCDSTSISYEKAEQLMEAVLYCIHEMEISGYHAIVSSEGVSAQQAYTLGFTCVKEKVKKALAMYHEILPDFSYYENQCLYDTFSRELPKFFQHYDIQFAPQETIVTLDYPVLKDISAYTGIDRIYAFILCIKLEQKFLSLFPEEYVLDVLAANNSQYRQMMNNICAPVFASALEHLLTGKPLKMSALEKTKTDDLQIKEILMQREISEIQKQLMHRVEAFVENYYGEDRELSEYLSGAVYDIVLQLKNTVEN